MEAAFLCPTCYRAVDRLARKRLMKPDFSYSRRDPKSKSYHSAPRCQQNQMGDLSMKAHTIGSVTAAGFAAALFGAQAIAQLTGTVDSHVAAAKAAAGNDHVALFNSLCRPAPGPAPAVTGPRPVPERSTWHYDP